MVSNLIFTKTDENIIIAVSTLLGLWELVQVIAFVSSLMAVIKCLEEAAEGRGFTVAHCLRVQAVV